MKKDSILIFANTFRTYNFIQEKKIDLQHNIKNIFPKSNSLKQNFTKFLKIGFTITLLSGPRNSNKKNFWSMMNIIKSAMVLPPSLTRRTLDKSVDHPKSKCFWIFIIYKFCTSCFIPIVRLLYWLRR